MQRPINRAQPAGPPQAYKTYQVACPLTTHFRPAGCAEVDCAAHRNGWRTIIDETTELGRQQAAYIRTQCLPVDAPSQPQDPRRRYIESNDIGCATVFTFPPGQTCFSVHQVPLERPELYIVRDGDWRGNPRGTPPRRHSGPDPWLNDFGEHQARIIRAINQG